LGHLGHRIAYVRAAPTSRSRSRPSIASGCRPRLARRGADGKSRQSRCRERLICHVSVKTRGKRILSRNVSSVGKTSYLRAPQPGRRGGSIEVRKSYASALENRRPPTQVVWREWALSNCGSRHDKAIIQQHYAQRHESTRPHACARVTA